MCEAVQAELVHLQLPEEEGLRAALCSTAGALWPLVQSRHSTVHAVGFNEDRRERDREMIESQLQPHVGV